MNTPLKLLNNLTPSEFLAEYWQKKPLLIKAAIPNFSGLLTPNELAGLACEDEVQARLIVQKSKKWRIQQGPFEDDDFAKLPEKDWTLLVQSVNHHLPEAANLLSQFDFIPHARLDDLMVSYAPDGGGVGPHFDSYDVFLLQGSGKRLWRVSSQQDLSLVEGAPLRILQNFNTEQEWLLEAGDMLYLPPHIAHWGIATGDDCMTYSIGFRAPKHQELASEFLGFMQDKIQLDGIYTDVDLSLQNHPAEISTAMIAKVSAILQKINWNETDIAQFLGAYISEPKQEVVFEPPKKINLTTFDRHIFEYGIALDLKSQMLFLQHAEQTQFFMNGEAVNFTKNNAELLKKLADKRAIAPQKIEDEALLKQLFDWYGLGYLTFNN